MSASPENENFFVSQQPKTPKERIEEKGLEWAEEIKELQNKEEMEKEDYQRIIELAERIKKLFSSKEESLSLLWDRETQEKVLTDWQKDWEEFKRCEYPRFSPDGEKVATGVRDKKGYTIAVDGKTWEERFKRCEYPHFSPDGEKIMVVVKKGGKYYRLVREV